MGMAKLTLSERKVKILFVAVLLVVSGVLVYNYRSYIGYHILKMPIKQWNWKGVTLYFRADLREADKVPVYPNENAVYLDTMHTLVETVTILFKDAGLDGNPYYIVEEIEIVTKMRAAYQYLFATQSEIGMFNPTEIPEFKAEEVDSYDEILAGIKDIKIVLIHPNFADKTAIWNDGHVTYISGKTPEEFDLAVTKFQMIVLGIDLEEAGF